MVSTDVYLLGSGIRSTLQLTLETVQAVEASRVVFALHDDLSVIDSLRRWCPDVRDVASAYDRKILRRDAYIEIAEMVVREALAQPTVSLLVHGHPLLLVSASEILITRARDEGLTVRALPGISFLDTLLCDLEHEHGYGLQLFEASTMLEQRWLPNPSIPSFITQIATVLNYNITVEEPSARTLKPLVVHLLKVYPPNHICYILYSGSGLLTVSTSTSVKLAELPTMDSLGLGRRPTLHLPAI